MTNQNDPFTLMLHEVFGKYVVRFKESLDEMRVLERLFLTADPARFVSLEKDDEQKRIRIDAFMRMLDQQGYPIFRFGITFAWAELEAFIDDFLKSWLTHMTPPAELDVFDKVMVSQSIRTFERMTADERMAFYVRQLKAKVARGSEIKTFFAALDALGLKAVEGQDVKKLERSLTELQQIRNVLVHRGGIVDAAMLDKCPWLEMNPEIKLGERFPLDTESTSAYTLLILAVSTHVLERVEAHITRL